jgi:hypothetical protein
MEQEETAIASNGRTKAFHEATHRDATKRNWKRRGVFYSVLVNDPAAVLTVTLETDWPIDRCSQCDFDFES